jgi:ubiquinone/menaquinone biosynthesis C-methylase UbiE
MIKRITHAAVWRVNPREGNVFVSDYLKSILPSLKRNSQIKKILDVACGNGMGVTIPLLRIGYDLWCFDHVQSAINAIKQNAVVEGFNVHAKKADMYKKYPYKDNTFDATFCFQAIYHGNLSQIIFALKEIRRVTKKGGYVFVNFLPFDDILYDPKRNRYYTLRIIKNKLIGRSYHKQDKSEPHLFYPVGNFEHNVPHYYAEKDEVKEWMNKFFRNVKIRKIKRPHDIKWFFWLAYGKK